MCAFDFSTFLGAKWRFLPRSRHVITLFAALCAPSLYSQVLSDLSFDQLAEIQVTTASRHAESLSTTAAAISVLTGEEIHQSGVDSIPGALRLLPGMYVSRIGGSTWGAGARGTSTQFSTKVLVMVDGRSVYTPVFGGVFWDTQQLFIEDLDRIEVVLGSSSPLWGADAMNGVINIITKDASQTQGGLLYGGVDIEGNFRAGVRQGWKLGESVFGRIYVRGDENEAMRLPNGRPAGDASRSLQGGFRFDGNLDADSHWTLEGNVTRLENDYDYQLPSLAAAPSYLVNLIGVEKVTQADVLGRWERRTPEGGLYRLQAFVDSNERRGPIFSTRVRIADLEWQHSLNLDERHRLDWGLTARYTQISTEDRWVSFSPASDTQRLLGAYVQDQVTLVPEHVFLTLGMKVEDSSVSGAEALPGVKLSWIPSSAHTFWGGVSRAIRTPAYTELTNITDAVVYPPGVRDPSLPFAVRGIGNPSLESEHVISWDGGWRWRAASQLHFTFTAFLNNYTNLIKVSSGPIITQTQPTPALIWSLPQDNGMGGRTYGAELAARWQPLTSLRFDLACSHQHTALYAVTSDPFRYTTRGIATPSNVVSLSCSYSPSSRWSVSLMPRFMDRSVVNGIPAYIDLDARLAWSPAADFEVALVGGNLLDRQHAEGKPSLAGPTVEVSRTARLLMTWKY